MTALHLTQPSAAPGRAARGLFVVVAMTATTSIFGCGGKTTGSGSITNGAGATGGVVNANGQGAMAEPPYSVVGGTAGVATSTGGTNSVGGGPATGGTGGNPSSSGGTCPGSIMTVQLEFNACNIVLPDPPPAKYYATTSVSYTNSTHANPEALQYVLQYTGNCDGSGWTWMPGSSAYVIQLCTVSCNQLEADSSSQLFIESCAVTDLGP